MIGKIKGILSEISGNQGLIETKSGVYYEVYLTPDLSTKYNIGSPIELYTYQHVKEDILALYGFDDKKSKYLFMMLLSVDGVGPKLAFVVISFANIDQIISAVKSSDTAFFNSINGIGKKTAQKILLELSGKFDTEFELEKTTMSQDDTTVVEALSSLGFDKHISLKTLSLLDKNLTVESKIQQTIKNMTKK